MSNITRHVGIDHLGHKLVVVFREIPDDTDHCLVVQSSTLPDIYHDNLMNVIESQESQQTVNLYEVLGRRVFGDGMPMLQTLHNRGLLKKMSVDHVNLVPMPNRKLSLRDANAAINGTTVQQNTVEPLAEPVIEQVTHRKLSAEEQVRAEAESLIAQARLMESDAKTKREQAYELCPDLKLGGRPSKKQKA
jgi:hypothetical protein